MEAGNFYMSAPQSTNPRKASETTSVMDDAVHVGSSATSGRYLKITFDQRNYIEHTCAIYIYFLNNWQTRPRHNFRIVNFVKIVSLYSQTFVCQQCCCYRLYGILHAANDLICIPNFENMACRHLVLESQEMTYDRQHCDFINLLSCHK